MSELLVIDPSTGGEVGRVPRSDPDRLVQVARAAHPAWARTGAGDRAATLKAGARRLRPAVDDLALPSPVRGASPSVTPAAPRTGAPRGLGRL